MLRLLQDGVYERVGSNRTQAANLRIIAASNHDLEERVATGRFREELYYALNVFPIDMPALRDRVEDIPLLVNELIARMEKERRGSLRINSGAIMSLCRHDWPGNVRELANLVERLAIMHPYGVIGVQELPRSFVMWMTLTRIAGARRRDCRRGYPDWSAWMRPRCCR